MSCTLERKGYHCLLCEADRRARHLERCTRQECAACELIAGSADDTYATARLADVLAGFPVTGR